MRRCSDLGWPPAGRVLGASRHCPLWHLRDPASPALGAFLDGLRDASELWLSVLQRSEVPAGAVDQALVGDRCHGTIHVKVTISLFRTHPQK